MAERIRRISYFTALLYLILILIIETSTAGQVLLVILSIGSIFIAFVTELITDETISLPIGRLLLIGLLIYYIIKIAI